MALQISDTPISIIRKHATTLTTEDHLHHHLSAITMIRESLQKQEKQIAVDPLSLKQQEAAANIVPPPLQPPRSKFLSISQPNSATSSPRFASILSEKKSKVENLDQSPPRTAESYLQKSKSCGEGRACPPSDEFDLWSIIKHDTSNIHHHHHHGSFTKPEAMKESPRSNCITTRKNADPPPPPPADKGFKCSCLYIPGFGKAKPIRPKKEESCSLGIDVAISRTVSFEKFECGSWAPSPRAINPVVLDQVEGNDSVSSYFDLPSELIRCGAGGEDAHSTVAAAFVFDNKDIKGVLKNGPARGDNCGGRKSDASPRHVRFSTSPSPASSTCITPRLRKAREEFNAFLEAHTSA